MVELYKELKTIEHLEEVLHNRRIIIYGIGAYGQCLVDYLCSIDRREQIDSIVVTDISKSLKKSYSGFEILEAQDRFENIGEEWIVIAVSTVHRMSICELTKRYTLNYICISDRLHYQMNGKINRNTPLPVREIDFCVAGFAKCGTTSLFEALSGLKSIYLPKCKETLFFEWYHNLDRPEIFLEKKYFGGVEKGQRVGMIEPTFCTYAKEVRQLAGSEAKIIFLLRNPVDTLFSYFRMLTRSGSNGELEWLYQKSDFNDGMYTEYLHSKISMNALTTANYSFWIKQYLELFPKEQIKIIFFEDLVKEPQQEINGILKYIGCHDRYESTTLPHRNTGDFVMADKEGYMLAVQRRRLFMKQYTENEYTSEVWEELNRVKKEFRLANKIYNVKMTPEQKILAKDFLEEDVKWLESMTKRNLTELWNW